MKAGTLANSKLLNRQNVNFDFETFDENQEKNLRSYDRKYCQICQNQVSWLLLSARSNVL